MTSPASLGPAAAGSPYAVKLPIFEGPLDLLLHLIRINEVEVTDIPIARVGEQYLEYLELIREIDLDVAGEYLLMAATLAWIKSRMLLPQERDEDGEEIDPRAELVARLLEFQRFKEMAGELGERRLLGRDVFAAVAPGPAQPDDGEREIEVGLYELLAAFRAALAREGPSGVAHEVEVETVTVYDQMFAVMEKLGVQDAIEFDAVVTGTDGHRASKPIVVASFLAILELARLAALRLYQGTDANAVPAGPIHLRRAEDADAIHWRERIAEIM
jgi:segregation and condensation protein A